MNCHIIDSFMMNYAEILYKNYFHNLGIVYPKKPHLFTINYMSSMNIKNGLLSIMF